MTKFRHITDAERLQIEHGLRHGASIRKIAATIGKHHSTVAREVLARRIESLKGAAGRITNRCRRQLQPQAVIALCRSRSESGVDGGWLRLGAQSPPLRQAG